VVLPLPDEPIIAQKPPIMEPDTSSRRTFGGLDFVDTVKFLKFKTTGALSGAIGEYVFFREVLYFKKKDEQKLQQLKLGNILRFH
jgi:hypothetical protein